MREDSKMERKPWHFEEDAYGYNIISGISPDLILDQIQRNQLLSYHYKINTPQIQKRIIDVFLREPSRSDCPGFIYGFRNKDKYKSSATNYQIKLGRTKLAAPQDRIFQWEKQDKHEYVQIFTIRSQYNMKIEALVHLFFAYARKTLYINGKRRIEWFQFKQKVQTAAVTNLINALMEKIHEKGFNQISPQKIIDTKDKNLQKQFQDIIKKLIVNYDEERVERKAMLIGMPKSGKTVIRYMLFDIELKSLQKGTNRFQIQPTIQSYKSLRTGQIVEVQAMQSTFGKVSLEDLFNNWLLFCSTNHISLALVIKQADLQCSLMSGLLTTLRFYQQYFGAPEKLPVAVTFADEKFTSDQIQQIIKENQPYLNTNDHKDISALKFYIFHKAVSEGEYPLSKNLDQVQKRKALFKDNLISENKTEFKFQIPNENIRAKCHSLIQFIYKDLQSLYLKKVQKRLNQFTEEGTQSSFEQKINFIRYMKESISYLLSDKTKSHQKIYETLTKINKQVDFEKNQRLQIAFYVFCQCLVNNTLTNSLIFQQALEALNIAETSVNNIIEGVQSSILADLSSDIEAYLLVSNGSGLLNQEILAQIIAINQLPTLIKRMQFIIEMGVTSSLQNLVIDVDNQDENEINRICSQRKMINSIQKLLDFLKKKDAHGKLRIQTTFGKIKQTLFLASDNFNKSLKKKNKLKKQKEIQENNQSSEAKTDEKLKISQNKKLQKHEITNISEQQYEGKCLFLQCNSMTSLFNRIQRITSDKQIINIVAKTDSFIIDCPEIIIQNTIIIMAKTITVKQQFHINFSQISVDGKNLAFTFVIMGQNLENYQLINIPKYKKHAKVCVLSLIGEDLIPLDPYYCKNPQKLEGEYFQGLAQIYKGKLL